MSTSDYSPIPQSQVGATPIFEPREFVNYFVEHLGLDCIDVGESCISCYTSPLLSRLIEMTGAQETRCWILRDGVRGGLYNFHLGGRKVSLLPVEFGAPFCSTMMEILIACGVKDFITVGSAETLQEEFKWATS